MKNFNRRTFIKQLSALGVTAGAMSLSPISFAAGGRNVVIVGGGFGGATCARYLKMYDPSIAVTLVEKNASYVTCPFSNTVLAGLNDMGFITRNYAALSGQGGIKVIQDTVTAVDPQQKKISTKGGQSLAYDRLVMAPGIDFKWEAIEGYDATVTGTIPHAWQAGSQTELLKKQLVAMNDGGVVIISVPAGQFRAPPAPYERASMMAYYLSEAKPKSKILILDANADFEELALMEQAWDKLYPGMIEWVKSSPVNSVDAGAMTVKTADGQAHKGDVINIIPPQKAGPIAQLAGLTDTTGWCPVDQKTFSSSVQKDIHVIGDSCIAGEMAKAGSGANTQAKVCAAAIASGFAGSAMPDPTFITVFYGLIGKKYAISNASFYRYQNGVIKKTSGGISKLDASKKARRNEMKYAKSWYGALTSEAFG